MATPTPASSDTALLSHLAQAATQDAAELLRAEFALAKDELRADVKQAGGAIAGLAIGVVLLVLSLGLLSLAIVLAFGASALAALLLCIVYAAAGVGAALYSLRHFPRPLSLSKQRVERDIHEIAEATK